MVTAQEWRTRLVPFVVAAGVLAATAFVGTVIARSATISAQSQAVEIAQAKSRELEQTVLLRGASVDGLAAFLEAQHLDDPSIRRTFSNYAASLVESSTAIRSIQVVKGSQIELLYPITGNQKAIGLDVFADPARRALLAESIRTGETTMEGPFELVQGGSGLAIRRPIVDARGDHWGFAAVVVDWNQMVDESGVSDPSMGHLVSVTSGTEVLIGGHLEGDPVTNAVSLDWSQAEWMVNVVPSDGWPTTYESNVVVWSMGLLLAAVGAMYVRALLVRPEKLQAQRRLVLEELNAVEESHRALFNATPVAIHREDHSKVEKRIEELRAAGVVDLRSHLLANLDQLASILSEIQITEINPAGEQLSNRMGVPEQARTLDMRLNDQSVDSLLASVMAVAEGARWAQHTASDTGVDGRPVELVVRWHAAAHDGRPDYSNVYVVLQDVTDLTVARRQLETTLKSQNRFIASISHELRTPLTAVMGFSHELVNERGAYGPEDLAEFRDLIEHHAVEMSHIIEDLLVWSRSDIGEVTINFEPFEIGRLVERTLRSLPGCPAEMPSDAPTVDVMADPVRVRQILRNLVTNAMRYGGSEVSVEMRETNANIRIEVHDSGPEIPEEKVKSIFLPYQRLNEESTMPSSIGLGLAISRVLAELQDGSLDLERTETTNAFVLTLRKASRRAHLDSMLSAGSPENEREADPALLG